MKKTEIYKLFGYLEFMPVTAGFVTPVFIRNDDLFVEISSSNAIDSFEILSDDYKDQIIQITSPLRTFGLGDKCWYAFKWKEAILQGSSDILIEDLQKIFFSQELNYYTQNSIHNFIERYNTFSENSVLEVSETNTNTPDKKEPLKEIRTHNFSHSPQLATAQVIINNLILSDLPLSNEKRRHFEEALYRQYEYLINEGRRKYRLSLDESFSVYSDTIIVVLNNINNQSFGMRSSLKTYLFQVFSNKCIDLTRKRTVTRQNEHQAFQSELLHYPTTSNDVINKLLNDEKARDIRQYLETIGQKCKETLLLFEDGFSDKQIAERLQYSSAAVAKTNRTRCLERLKLFIKNQSFE